MAVIKASSPWNPLTAPNFRPRHPKPSLSASEKKPEEQWRDVISGGWRTVFHWDPSQVFGSQGVTGPGKNFIPTLQLEEYTFPLVHCGLFLLYCFPTSGFIDDGIVLGGLDFSGYSSMIFLQGDRTPTCCWRVPHVSANRNQPIRVSTCSNHIQVMFSPRLLQLGSKIPNFVVR